MLDTGIDVPEVVNLVFFKLVRSKTKFWQMLGRGTRLCPDLFGPGQHKTGFYRLRLLPEPGVLPILQASPDFDRLRDQIREIAGALELQEAVPAIKAEMVLIQAVAGDEWWTDVTLGMLENARKRLRALVKLIEKAARKIVYTDFVDQLGTETTVVLPEIANGLDMAKFKDKARQFLKAHEDHLALQRLRRSQPLTPTDLSELEQMLIEAGGTPEMISKVAAGSPNLGVFIRSLVGMDREAVYQAFNEFVSGTNATPDQLEFIDVIVSELTANGVVEAKRLYESPYLDISPQGPEALFPSAQVDRMFQILEEFKKRAAA
jgi:type I restriction enzyme R subunit